RRPAGALVAHHVHLGAAHADAQLARFGDGDLVRLRAFAHRVAAAGDAVRAAADRGDRGAVAFHLAMGGADERAVRDAPGDTRRRLAREPGSYRRDSEQGASVFRGIDLGRLLRG